MFVKLEDKNLYILSETDNSITVTYSNSGANQYLKINTKKYRDKYKNSFNITNLGEGIFCIHNISIKHIDLIQDILTTAIYNHETNNPQNIFLYRLIIGTNKFVNYDFGGLNIKIKNNFYDISIYDKAKSSNLITFKLHNNITICTNLALEKLQVNGSLIFEFKKYEKIRYLQFKNEKVYIYFPVNEMYKIKLFTIIDQLLANHV